jgi:hypothetical protein
MIGFGRIIRSPYPIPYFFGIRNGTDAVRMRKRIKNTADYIGNGHSTVTERQRTRSRQKLSDNIGKRIMSQLALQNEKLLMCTLRTKVIVNWIINVHT